MTVSKSRINRKKLAVLAAQTRRRALFVIGAAVIFCVGLIVLAYSSAMRTTQQRDQTIAPASSSSFTTPSKEYIYAGGRLIATEEPPNGGSGGQPQAVFDFEPDHKTEIAYYRSGLWGVLKSSQSYGSGTAQFFSWGGPGLPPLQGDFDGDSKADIGYIVPPTGGQGAAYAILKSSANYDFGQALFFTAGFPSLGDQPVVGDFDADGKADPGIWRESTGVWTIPLSQSNYTSYIFAQWGQSGDKPIVADFDGDGKADIGYYRSGVWGVLKSTQNYSFASPLFLSWGRAGLPPIVADFDGDGKADVAYIAPPTGGHSAAYAILKSTTNYNFNQAVFVGAGFPSLGDTPVVGDWDGDGKADPGVWRSSQGLWIIPLSSSNYGSFLFAQWGQSGDTPLPSKANY